MSVEDKPRAVEDEFCRLKLEYLKKGGSLQSWEQDRREILFHKVSRDNVPEPDQGPDVPPEVKLSEYRGPVVHGDCEPSQLKRRDDIKPPVIDETEPPQPTAPDKQPTEKETTLFNPRNNPFYKGR